MLESLRRDLRTVANGLLGRRSSPFLVRGPLGRHTNVIDPLGARSLRITRVVRETADAVTLHLHSGPGGGELDFTPGQFLTLLVEIGGEQLRRAYSLCTTPSEGLAITIKRNGRVSNHLNDHAKEGDLLRVLGPSGNFGFRPDPAVRRRVLLVAGGSGITPLMSIAKSVLAIEPESEVALVYANRAREDVIFHDALEALAAAHPQRFCVRHVFGLFDPKELAPFVVDGTEIFLCGPAGMMDVVRASLPGREIREERFSSPGLVSTRASSPQQVTVSLRGGQRQLVVTPDQTILESALQAGLSMPFSCGMGGCGACKVKLVSGDVSSDEPNCLTSEERERGYVLTCVSRACSKVELAVEEAS
ncbi:MAG: 2Fe-2S iron-sulfur cluster-binding protein [Polyangiales bacterium]